MNEKNFKDDKLLIFFQELGKVQDNYRLLVIVTHGFIELLLNTIIDYNCKNGKKKITKSNRDYTHSVKLVILNELDLLDDKLYKILDWFRKLRNRAAHEPFFKINDNDIKFMNNSTDRFLPGGAQIDRDNVFRFCTLLVGTIWNKHVDILTPIFSPTIGN